LLFDPTDPITPVGEIPDDEQGAFALVVAGNRGDLVRTPKGSAEEGRIESTVTGVIGNLGRLDATIERRYFGQSGVTLRGIELYEGAPELKKRFERSFSRRIPGAVLASIKSEPVIPERHVALNVGIAADSFAQRQGRLLIVRPGLLTSGGEYYFPAEERSGPVLLAGDVRQDSIRVRIPEGYTVDERPRNVKLESPYGTLETSWSVRDGEIQMEERFEIRETLAPASEYPKIREFFELVGGAHTAPLVLVRP
jgi:hypothetical protein